MRSYNATLMKALSPKVFGRIMMTFDKMTLLIVSICWAMTALVMMFALYTVHLTVEVKKSVDAALATEPKLPEMRQTGVGGKELTALLESLKQQYPDIKVIWKNNNLTLSGTSGNQYHQWLLAIGQVDTLYPQFHWSINGLCIGKECGDQNLMLVTLSGRMISLEMPTTDEKK